MLRLASQRLDKVGVSPLERVRFIQDDALTTEQMQGPYDLVVTNFFLDCLDPDSQRFLMRKVAPQLAERARWLVTDFEVNEPSKTAGIFRLFTQIMYLVFQVTTGLENRELSDFSEHLERAGFRSVRRREWLIRFLVSVLWERSKDA